MYLIYIYTYMYIDMIYCNVCICIYIYTNWWYEYVNYTSKHLSCQIRKHFCSIIPLHQDKTHFLGHYRPTIQTKYLCRFLNLRIRVHIYIYITYAESNNSLKQLNTNSLVEWIFHWVSWQRRGWNHIMSHNVVNPKTINNIPFH